MPFFKMDLKVITRREKLKSSLQTWFSDGVNLLSIGVCLTISLLVAGSNLEATEFEKDTYFEFAEENMTPIEGPPIERTLFFDNADYQPRVKNRCFWVKPGDFWVDGNGNGEDDGLADDSDYDRSIPEITIYITSSSNSYQIGDRLRMGFKFEKYSGSTRSFYHYFEFVDTITDGGISYQEWKGDESENNDDLEWLRHQQTAELHSRAYWDKMHLIRNNPGGASVMVHAIDFRLDYYCKSKSSGKKYKNNERILVSNMGVSGAPRIVIDETLYPTGSINVTPYIIESLDFVHEIVDETPEVIKLMVKDVGKYGSDSQDNYGVDNAKYDEHEEESQCSETVSWYYYNYLQKGAYGKGLQISTGTPAAWKEIDLTYEMMDIFENAGQLYRFVEIGGQYKWCKSTEWRDNDYNTDDCSYKPKQADYIAWYEPGSLSEKSEHSMILRKDWDSSNPTKIKKLDGPWPLKSITDNLDADDEQHRRWYAGKVRETLSISNRFWDSDNLFRADRVYFSDINLQPEGTLTAMGTVIKLQEGFHARPGSGVILRVEKGIIGYHKQEEYECVENECEVDGIPCCDDMHCVGNYCQAL